jgi:hypothetical protein
MKELHVRCGPDHLAIIRQTEAGLVIGDGVLPLPPEVNVALDPRRRCGAAMLTARSYTMTSGAS